MLVPLTMGSVGCSTLHSEQTLLIKLGTRMEPYVQEVFADDPLGHWRLEGEVEGALGATSKGRFFKDQELLELKGADFGGTEFAVEMWVKDVGGDLLTYTTPKGPRGRDSATSRHRLILPAFGGLMKL